MKIKILGSGGGEGFPATFCCCEHCETARKMGGKSLRTLSQSLINDDLLIDFPADTYTHCLRYNINLGKIPNMLITHSHRDHFLPHLLADRGSYAAHDMKYENFYIYAPGDVKKICDNTSIPDGIRKNIIFPTLTEKEPIKIGEYTVTPFKAYHAPDLNSLNYIIEQNGKSILYFIDSGYPPAETLEFLKSTNKVFDLVVMDSTMGVAPPATYIYHMGYEENKMLKNQLIELKLADSSTRFVITHITHNNSEYHEKVEEIFAGTGIQVAYDGFEAEI